MKLILKLKVLNWASLLSYRNRIPQLFSGIPFLVFIFIVSASSCKDTGMEEYLNNGLNNYRKSRDVNKVILEGYEIKKLAFFKEDSLRYQFVFQLNENAIPDSIATYGLGLVYFVDQKYLNTEKGYIIHQMKPELETFNNYKYIIETVTPPAKYIDSLHIYLSGREQYTGVIGKMVLLKNIEFK